MSIRRRIVNVWNGSKRRCPAHPCGCRPAVYRQGEAPSPPREPPAGRDEGQRWRSGDRFQPLLGKIPRHDRDRDRQQAGVAGELGDQRAGALLVGAGAQHQHADFGVLADLGDDLIHRLAFADHQLGVDVLPVAHPFGEDLEMRMNALARLFAHHFADADPVVELVRRDHRENLDPPTGMVGPHRGEPHRVQAFSAVIQHDEEFAHLSTPCDGSCPPSSLRTIGYCCEAAQSQYSARARRVRGPV
uniref:Uncharacterized protein n=1 Tax=uncultured Rhodobacterales bacterium HF4000_03E16 TaxID=710785 RepID=E0XV99_9RHOB|nr:hypothetical protein [uncultured Rhodobacterales bacterium HF4000_03E16]